jgi:bis(5'-nucleosyl)-tetraphosphatase (symmetrical)
MAMYLIGDVQGCDSALQRLLDTIAFSPSRDTLYLLGDLVNRGPESDRVLRRLMAYGSSARCLLGNHDLHLLAVAHGVRAAHRSDTLECILQAPDRPALLHWLQHQALALELHTPPSRWLMVHAGVLPQWTADQTLSLAAEVQTMLRGPDALAFFQNMYGSQPQRWSDDLQGWDRLRVIVNALTRMRFCSADGAMDFSSKEGASAAPAGTQPWFELPERQTAHCVVAFGHWSTLGWLGRADVFALDSGCVWGGCLTALEISSSTGSVSRTLPGQTLRHTVQCEATQTPGRAAL